MEPVKDVVSWHGFVAQIGLWDSLYESSVVADGHEQLDTDDIQDQELVRL